MAAVTRSYGCIVEILPGIVGTYTSEGFGQKNVGLTDEIEDIPEASQLARRPGGASLSKARIRSAFGVKKYDAPMSGVATSTRKGYTRLWYEWVRFCAFRRHGLGCWQQMRIV